MKCRSEELEKVQKFYGELLGLPLVRSWGEPKVEGLMYGAGPSLIESFPNAEEDLPQGAIRHFALATDDVDSIVEAARKAAEQGIRIYTIGIGTPEGAPIQIGGEFIKDENGEMVVSKLNEQMLEQIASTTGGAYVRATKQSIGLDEIVKSIDAMEKSDLATVRFEEYNEQYQYPLAAALVLLVLDVFILSRRNPRLRRFNIFREHRTEEQ